MRGPVDVHRWPRHQSDHQREFRFPKDQSNEHRVARSATDGAADPTLREADVGSSASRREPLGPSPDFAWARPRPHPRTCTRLAFRLHPADHPLRCARPRMRQPSSAAPRRFSHLSGLRSGSPPAWRPHPQVSWGAVQVTETNARQCPWPDVPGFPVVKGPDHPDIIFGAGHGTA